MLEKYMIKCRQQCKKSHTSDCEHCEYVQGGLILYCHAVANVCGEESRGCESRL